MRLCPNCGATAISVDWRCPGCGWVAPVIDGFSILAPDLLQTYDGYNATAHDSFADIEAGHFWFTTRNKIVRNALQRFFPDARSLLEIGCGNGFVLAALASALPELRVVGSEAMLSGLYQARARLPQAELVQQNARHLPYEAEFDVVGAFDVLEHITEDEEVLQQIRRVLKPAGGLLLTVPQHPWLWSAADDYACHKRRYLRSELLHKLTTAGFRPLRLTSFMSLLLPLMVVSRLRARRAPHRSNQALELEFRPPAWINRALGAVCTLERGMLWAGLDLPIGGSLLCVAVKSDCAAPRSAEIARC